MSQDVTLVGAKEFYKRLTIINSVLAYVTWKNYKCICLNTLMYL